MGNYYRAIVVTITSQIEEQSSLSPLGITLLENELGLSRKVILLAAFSLSHARTQALLDIV